MQAIGDVVLDCSDVTDPIWSSSRGERDGLSTRSSFWEWVKVWEEQGLRVKCGHWVTNESLMGSGQGGRRRNLVAFWKEGR